MSAQTESPDKQGTNATSMTARALALVSDELLETVRAAHLALEECVDGRGGSAALTRTAELLHQVRGALRMTETYGAALLTEEMEAVCRHVIKLKNGQGRDEGLDALTRAMVQLPTYIERLLGGGRDIALVLLPLLNDLRAVRGKPLLSEGTLLLLNLSPSRQAMVQSKRETSGEDPATLAAKLRPRFQLALLGLIKGGNAQKHLKALADVSDALQRAASRDDMHQLFWVLGGVLESLGNGGLEVSVSVKRLLGQADRQLKRLIDEGPEIFADQAVTDLQNNLLYYVARSSNAGPRVSEIRAAFNLSDLLPGDEQVAHAREGLSAPSIKLMRTVGAAIKEDLGRVKDVLDIFVRTGMNKSSELVPQLDLLKKISDTLGVLGLGELRGNVDAEIERLKTVVRDSGEASESTVLEIASTLLRVEDRLDQQLMRQISPQRTAAEPSEDAGAAEDDTDYKQVSEAVMRESIINLARIKETFSQAMTGAGDSHGVDAVPSLIRGIKAGLMMLNKQRAMKLFESVGDLIMLALSGEGPKRLEQREMDRLADAIVSIEYYMETVKAGRKDPDYMLDNAESCLGVLDDAGKRLHAEKGTAEADVEPGEEPAAEPAAATHQVTSVLEEAPVVASDAEHLDPELLELFIEEAKEEIATIRRNLPQWIDNPGDMETLITVRRSFHTLKGSGRMVGAERIGEYCWSIENLLNRLINGTLTRTPPMMSFISTAADAVPELVEQLEVGSEPKADVALIMARANAFADGDPNAAVLTIAPVDQEADEQAPALEMDPVLLDIFAKETDGHLEVIREFVETAGKHRPPYHVTDKLYRSAHTLHGSANMANVDRGVAVTRALNRYVRRVHDYQVGFDADGLRALDSVADAIAVIVDDINQPNRDRQDYNALIDHLEALTAAIEPPPEEADSAEDGAGEAAAADGTAVEAPAADDAVEGDYDAEIAAIFSEEAAEILEESDRALAAWSHDRSSRQHVEELKRHLHTLKGGARMAGITAMGNLSHELETLLIGIDDGRVNPTDDVDSLLQQSIDELHRMRDTVIAGRRVSPASQLENRIRKLTAGGDAAIPDVPGPDPDSGASDEALPAEFSPEPVDPVSMTIVSDDKAGPLDTGVTAGAGQAEELPDGDAGAALDFELPDEPGLDAPAQPLEPGDLPPVTGDAEVTEPEVPGPAAETPDEEPEVEQPPAEEPPADQPEVEEPPAEEPLPEEPDIEEPPASEPDIEEPPAAAGAEAGGRRIMRVAPDADAAGRSARARGGERAEIARIDAELLEDLLNAAGEISIYHSRLSQQVNSVEFHVAELEQTVARLRDQLRNLDIETEAQIMHAHQDTMVASKDFDPLEMDRYSNIQQLSRALAETASDMGSLKDLLQNVTAEAETLLVQQSRVTAELQDGLMRTRMVPFQRHVPRLTRLVRQVATEVGKRAELAVEGGSGELDRQVLEKMLPPFEHMMRNAVIHGIETPEARQAAGKPAGGRITIRLHREGAEMVIDVADDGGGLDVDAIRRKAFERELLRPDSKVTDNEIMQLILTPGFSTAGAVTQSAGRGVGMDVVANKVKQLGGSLQISSVIGQGTNFTIRLPFTLAITQALVVRTGDEVYALPLPTVEGVARIKRSELKAMLERPEPTYEYGEQTYHFRHLGMFLGGQAAALPEEETFVPVILVRAGDQAVALLTDEMLASQEIVVKSLGPQLSSVRGVSGATILGDGRIVLILDINSLVRAGMPVVEIKSAAPSPADARPLAMVVDDSITVRRVMERFLSRNGLRVVTAKDGIDAISALRDVTPDIILLDIEMPRMDGYEFATHVRNDERVSDVPIIMITSRTGDKHRARAIEIGVNDYVGKPYQDAELLDAIARLLQERGVNLS